jgi:IPT/TIG domain
MNPEEYLDRLIERREHGEGPLPAITDAVALSLAAAEVLVQLREIAVPSEFAGRLERSIRACILAQQNGRTISIVRPRSSADSPRFPMRRAWIVMLKIAAVLILASAGILWASVHSLPGDALYGLKQAEHQLTLNFASGPVDRASVQIDQLQSTLVDLRASVTDGHADDAIRLALHMLSAETNDSRGAVAALPAGAQREAAQRNLDGVLAEEEQTVRHLLDRVDWPMQLAFTQQLGALGDPVPTVTQVLVRTQSNGTLLITLTGTHFAPQVKLLIDGRPGGMVSQRTSEQLVVVISTSAWPPGEHTLGVRNPDGTAAQVVLDRDDQQGSDHHWSGTPQPTDNSGE